MQGMEPQLRVLGEESGVCQCQQCKNDFEPNEGEWKHKCRCCLSTDYALMRMTPEQRKADYEEEELRKKKRLEKKNNPLEKELDSADATFEMAPADKTRQGKSGQVAYPASMVRSVDFER